MFKNTANVLLAKLFTRKDLFIMETSIADFHSSFYIPTIKKLAFHLPCVRILGSNHHGNTQREALKCRANQYLLCCRDYAYIVVASLT